MKSMKKLVLAGLVLLASVMVLVGCKNTVEPSGVDEIIVPEGSSGIDENVPDGSSGIDEIVPVLTFSADSEQTLTVKIQGKYTLHESLQYAVGSGEWQKLEADKAITFGGATGSLRMRGKSARGMAKDETNSAYIFFSNKDVPVACDGDIRTLVDWENYSTADTSKAGFSAMFKDCTNLTSAPALPATELAMRCYYGMFDGCTSLTSAPELPATELAESCYYRMFYGCTNLTSAPALPATELAGSCYYRMFYGCSKISSVTILATKIEAGASGCFTNWLYGCASKGTIFKAADSSISEDQYNKPTGWELQVYESN